MKRYAIIGLIFFSLILSVCHAEYRDGYLLVRFDETGKTSTASATRQGVVEAAGGGTIKRMYSNLVPGLGLVQLPVGTTVTSAQTSFESTDGVLYAEPDYIQRIQLTPNDPDYTLQWGLHNTGQTGGTIDADIDAPEAWDIAIGSRNVIVAVIDTGVDYEHIDLVDNMWINGPEQAGVAGIDDDGNGYVDDIYGYNFVLEDGEPLDENGHGTHVAGIIGAIGSNAEGVAGVNWNVSIMVCRAFTAEGTGSVADTIEALMYAVNNGAIVSNNSYGFEQFSQAQYDAIMAARNAGHLMIVAAGNDSRNIDVLPVYPASYAIDSIISVLSTDHNDQLSSLFSNYGNVSVDIGAPGGSALGDQADIYSTLPDDEYGYMAGTSMATPYVAGAAALLWSVNPFYDYADVKQALLGSADQLSSLQNLCVSGGRLNLHEALLYVPTAPPDEGAFIIEPDPSTWEIEPTATGLHHIVMKASEAAGTTTGLFIDGFENGDFSARNWQFYGSSNWIVQTNDVYAGNYTARSGDVTHSQTSALSITLDTMGYESIRFARKVSSEEFWDYLVFYIDGIAVAQWSGEVEWDEFSYPVTSGVHTFEWSYEKDTIISYGSDCAWLDNIILTSSTGEPSFIDFEYEFDCIEDNTYDTVQDELLYIRSDYDPDTLYSFRVRARDKTNPTNRAAWSETRSTTTSATVDDLPPAPGPISLWGAKPRNYTYRRDEETIFMQAGETFDESGLEYIFDCTDIYPTDSGVNPDDLDSVQTSRDYVVDPAKVFDGYRYTFKLTIRDSLGNALQASPPASVAVGQVVPRVLRVPLVYDTIQEAINDAYPGDVVELQANRTYTGIGNRNIDFLKKQITVRSENPEDPAVVASTIIDCQGTLDGGFDNGERHAFWFHSGEDPNCLVNGITIINAFGVNNPMVSSGDGIDARGGAILCENSSSPTISNCVIRDCYAQGQDGADAPVGTPANPDPGADGTEEEPPENGGDGGDAAGDGYHAGSGRGGALYADATSSPIIFRCTIENTYAVGGEGGDGGQGADGGDGGNSYWSDPNLDESPPQGIDPNVLNGGNGGNGGDGSGNGGNGGLAEGGAFYFEGPTQARIINCTIDGCEAIIGAGGAAGTGGEGGQGGLGDPDNGEDGQDGQDGASSGIPGVSGDYARGGAVSFGMGSQPIIEGTDIQNCSAEDGSALYFIQNCTATVESCNITGCSGVGSTINLGQNNQTVFTETEISNNFGGDAALYAQMNTVFELNACLFRYNLSTGSSGGAVYAAINSQPTINACEFSDNIVLGDGGAVYAYDTTSFHAVDTIFEYNTVGGSGDGGAIFYGPDINNTAVFEVTGSTFQYNSAGIGSDPSQSSGMADYGNGGAVCVYPNWGSYDPDTNITLDDCIFNGNESDTGGAVFTWHTNVLIDSCTFSGNISELGGGAFWYDADLTITNSSFDNNFAANTDGPTGGSSGGALYCLDASARVYNSKFAENSAEFYGGAIAMVGTFYYVTGGTQDIINCMMTENTAVDNGGAVSVIDGAEPFMINCTMESNIVIGTAGFGGAVSCQNNGDAGGATYVLLENSIVWDNLAEFGPQVAVGDPLNLSNEMSMLELSYTDIQGEADDVFLGQPVGSSAVYVYGGVIDEDPLFVEVMDPNDPIDRTYYLQQLDAGQPAQSHCVDTGIGNIVDLETLLGFEVTTRTTHVRDDDPIDMGFHYDAGLPVNSFTLTTAVYTEDRYQYGTIDEPWAPGTYENIPQGTMIELVAVPDPNFQVLRWIGSDDDTSISLTNTVTMYDDRMVMVEFEPAVSKKLYVPEPYVTIEDAVAVARDGDIIVVSPRPDTPYLISTPGGINFRGKQLVITSTNPEDPAVVASTIIDCQGSRANSQRAFHFNNGEGPDSQILGITIRNAFTAVIGESAIISTGYWPWWTGSASWYQGPLPGPDPWNLVDPSPDPIPPMRALSGVDAEGDSYGGAILCENGSSPTFYKCVFENCTVSGAVGGDGADGDYADDLTTDADLDSQSGGHSGSGSGDGYGGAIAVLGGSNPQIKYCEFYNNQATGGRGGIPGNAGNAYNDGRYGWGGNDPAGLEYARRVYGFDLEGDSGYGAGDGHGGAIYVAAGCDPYIYGCVFENNFAHEGYSAAGGSESPNGGEYDEPFNADTQGALISPDTGDYLDWGANGGRNGQDAGTFLGNRVAGGAVYIEQSADVRLDKCHFVSNNAYAYEEATQTPQRGGAIFSDINAKLIINDCNFVNTTAGAVYCMTGSDLSVYGSDFINNTSYYPTENVTTILADGTEIAGSTSAYAIAGGLTIEANAAVEPNIVNCRFLGNSSYVGGAAVRTLSDTILSGTILNGNSSYSDGGAIYGYDFISGPDIHTIKLSLMSCELSGNNAHGTGGGIYVKNCALTIDESFLVNNTAFSGGGLYISQSDLTLSKSLLYGNEATGVIAGAHRTITEEGFGGGVYVTDSPFMIIDSRFENNLAMGSISAGGGLCVTGSQTYYDQNVFNCLFANNRSDNNGGGVSCQLYVDIDFDNCTFADNEAANGGALFVNYLSSASLMNSIVAGNTGIGIYELESGQTEASYTLFYDNEGGDVRDGTGTIHSGISGAGYANRDNFIADPLFVSDLFGLGAYYLNQTDSPAVDAGSDFADVFGLDEFTTDPDGMLDTWIVDLGYHYPDPSGITNFDLTVMIVDTDGDPVEDAGTVTADFDQGYKDSSISFSAPRGAVIPLTANIAKQYYLTGWYGGTFDDNSEAVTNGVLMTRDKDILVVVRLRRTINMGGSAEYDILGDAIEDAQDGDIILVAPGEYTSASQYPSSLNNIILDGKKITISGSNPDDEATVRGTIFRDYQFSVSNVDAETIIEGITIEQGSMDLLNADLIIRNCVFSECQFNRASPVHTGNNIPQGTDGYSASAIFGGAMAMYNSSPAIIGTVFENNWVRAGNGENGFQGGNDHPMGGDGGWPSPTYGGAVYCGLSSAPTFDGCIFTGNEVFGGNGGNGADFVTVDNTQYYGGRGGGWVYDTFNEELLRTTFNDIPVFDGWTYNSYGDKYSSYSPYADFFGEYDLEDWIRWFNWTDQFSSWAEFETAYNADSTDPVGDPYDQLMDAWRYSAHGGAVFCELDSDATFKDCVFEDNQSHGGLTGVGGQHYALYNETPWPDRQLNMPTAGGAVFAAMDSDLTFENCKFVNNFADTSTVDLPHTYQVSFGGAVAYEYNCKVVFKDCNVAQNNATVGGGIYGFASEATVTDCNVFDNTAYLGAGMYLDDQKAELSGNLFHENRAGIADVVGTDESPEMSGQGGGLYAHVLDLKLYDSRFVENTAEISGGGLMLSGTVDKKSDIFNCLFAQNLSARDGGGASVNWYGGEFNDGVPNAVFTNCTFADNDVVGDDTFGFIGTGGGLFCGYDSVVKVLDSIFHGNSASEGTQITVQSTERQSYLRVEYTNIAGFPSADALHIAPGCELELVEPYSVSVDPEDAFVSLSALSGVEDQYYLDQTKDYWINDGSRLAVQAVSDDGQVTLNQYTTSVNRIPDKGQVDLGYHYPLAYRSICGIIDEALLLSGMIDLEDWAEFASYWLSLTECGEGNDWCGGADLNYDTLVNIDDVATFIPCWLQYDDEAPTPDPAKWLLQPRAVENTFDAIEMAAVVHHDNWWPDEWETGLYKSLQYQFWSRTTDGNLDILIVDQDDNADGWLIYDELGPESKDSQGNVIQIYATWDASNDTDSYYYYVRVRDGSGIMTDYSDQTASVAPGSRTEIPTGDFEPETEDNPYSTVWNPGPDAQEAVRLVAQAYDTFADAIPVPTADFEVRYKIIKVGENLDKPFTTDRVYWDLDVVAGEFPNYQVQMAVFNINTNKPVSIGPFSDPLEVEVLPIDVDPPTPDPAEHMANPSSVAPGGIYYQYVYATVADDPSGVEYRFICSNDDYSSGGNFDDGPKWRSVNTVGTGTANPTYPAGLTYNGSTIQVPNVYVVSTTSLRDDLIWWIFYADSSPNHNVGTSSDGLAQNGDTDGPHDDIEYTDP